MTDQIISDRLSELRARRAEILAVANKYGAYNVRVFGSTARGDASADSDIDFLVNFKANASLYELSGLRQALSDLLNREVDVVEDHPGLRDGFRWRILKDAIEL